MRHSKRSGIPGFTAVLLAFAIATGCSRYTMESSPIWDTDTRNLSENRVNLWPVVYWRDPALSVLWPFYTATDAGNALVPLYEYRRDEQTLRIGTIHPEIPSLFATVDSKNQYTRVLNTVVDRKNKDFVFFPFYFQNYGKYPDQFLFPVWYHDGDGFWTPLVTWRDDLKGALGPLFCRYQDGGAKKYYAPWPLVAWWKDGNERYARAFPLFRYRHDGKDYCDWALAGLGGRYRDGRDSGSWLVPLWYSETEGRDSKFISLPYMSVRSGDHIIENALLNAYVSVSEGDQYHRSALWPVVNWWHKPGSDGQSVLPFYRFECGGDGVSSFLSPLYSFKSDGSMRNIGLVLFHESNANGKRFGTVLWPMAQWWGDSSGASGRMVLPLFYETKAPGKHTLITPLGASSRGGDLEYTNILGPVYYERSKPSKAQRYRTIAFPFWYEFDDGGNRRQVLAPLFMREKGIDGGSFMTPVYSRGVWSDSQFLNLGMILYHWSKDRHETKTSVLASVVGWSKDEDGSRRSWHVFPLGFYTSGKDYVSFKSVLNSRWHTRKSEDELRAEIRKETGRMDGFDSRISSIDRKYELPTPSRRVYDNKYLLGLAANQKTLTSSRDKNSSEIKFGEKREWWAFPFVYGYFDSGRESQFNLLWRLFDAKSEKNADGSDYTRRRVLWRLYHRETLGPKTSVDVFPFITWDSDTKADTRNFSFAWRMFGYSRKGDERTARVMFVPVRY
ncbi:hypothetical protein LLG95_17480 [bacterium]|nr:hypothetical protein [bacterium]